MCGGVVLVALGSKLVELRAAGEMRINAKEFFSQRSNVNYFSRT